MSGSLVASPLVPALLALALRWRSPPLAGGDRWQREDTVLAVGAAIVGAITMAWGTAPWVIREFPFTASDFAQYCEALEPIRRGDFAHVSFNRSVAGGVLPAVLAPWLGVVGGLAAASLLSTGGLCGALYVAGRALHSRTAGVAAVILAAAIPPLAALPRTVTFYPEIVASVTLCAACALASVRFRTAGSAGFAGLACALAFLVDVRGMLFAGPAAVVAIGGVLVAPGGARSAALRLAAIGLPVALSWWIGGRLQPELWALEDQAASFTGDALRLAGVDPGILPLVTPAERFRWGVDPLDHAIPAARYLARLGALLATHAHGSPQATELARKLGDWPAVLLASGILTLVGLRRRPELALAAVVTLAPFLASLRQAVVSFPHPRMIATSVPAVAVIAGVATAVMLGGALPALRDEETRDLRGELPTAARPAIFLLLLAAMVGGVLPSWLGPTRLWRTWNLVDSEPRDLLARTAAGEPAPTEYGCQQALRRDLAAGRALVPTWYGKPREGWEQR